MTKAQYIRWANRREGAAQHLRDAIKEMRDSLEVSEASELQPIHGGIAEDCVVHAMGCAHGAIQMLLVALGEMEQEVKS